MAHRRPSGMGFSERVPVDGFFDNYVTHLEHIGARGGAQAFAHSHSHPHDCTSGAAFQQRCYQTHITEANHYHTMMEAMDFQVNLGAHPNQMTGMAPMASMGPSPPVTAADQMGLVGPLGSLPDIDLMVGLNGQPNINQPNVEGGSLNYGPVSNMSPALAPGMTSGHMSSAGKPSPNTPAASSLSIGAHSGAGGVSNDVHEMQATSSRGPPCAEKPKRRRVRTEVQQEQNKQAQQRYRERKKLKACTMEVQVEELAAQVEELRRYKEENEDLQDKKTRLESELLEKEAQIKLLNKELKATKHSSTSHGEDEMSLASDGNNQAKVDAKAMWHSKVEELQNIFDVNGLKAAKPTGEGVPEDVVGMIGMLVEEVTDLASKMVREEGVNVLGLAMANVDSCNHMCDEQVKHVWAQVAKHVELSQDQVSKARILRTEHLKKLEDIYVRRQTLNLDAISVLLPTGNVSNIGNGQPSSFFIGGCGLGGFFSRTKNGERITKVLDALKENLKEEQRLASELQYIVFNRLLKPIQASWFILEAYPCPGECLALLNGCHSWYFKENENA